MPSLFDAGSQTATGGQIAADPFTASIASFTYAAPSETASVSGGPSIFFGTGGEPFV